MFSSSHFYHALCPVPCIPRALPYFHIHPYYTLQNNYCSSLPRRHSCLLMYLNEGLFGYLEHSSAGVNLRRDKAKAPMHIKNCFFLVAACRFSIWHLSLFFSPPCKSAWDLIRRGFSYEVPFSSIWITLPGLTEGCLESCSVYSRKQITSVLGLDPRCPGN